jgi:hypothetical protein
MQGWKFLNRNKKTRWCVTRQGATETLVVAGPFKSREDAEKEKIRLEALADGFYFSVTTWPEDRERRPRARTASRKAGR